MMYEQKKMFIHFIIMSHKKIVVFVLAGRPGIVIQ